MVCLSFLTKIRRLAEYFSDDWRLFIPIVGGIALLKRKKMTLNISLKSSISLYSFLSLNFCPHFFITSITGSKDRPNSVKEYSTLGGTTG